MSPYKAILKILKANQVNLIVAVIVTVIITFFYAQNTVAPDEILEGGSIAVINEDNSTLSKSLTDYLTETQTLVDLPDTSQKTIDDALYFGKVDYILFLPKDFSKQIEADEQGKIEVKARPDAYAKTLVENQINSYLSTFQTFYAVTNNSEKAITETKRTLAVNGEVTISSGYGKRVQQQFTGLVFNTLAYGVFLSIFSAYGAVNLVFNRKEIKERNQVSPVSTRRLNWSISTGMLGYSFILATCFTVGLLLYTQSGFTQMTGYLVLNMFCFLLPIITFSTCITSMVKNSEALNGISNIYIMGSCFLGGVFVATDFLPDFVSRIAAFTPTYWFVQNNQLIGSATSFNTNFQEKFWFNCLILLLFSGAFLVIQFVLKKDQRWFHTKKFFSKVS
jgi:ABC-2 type transport system permease protein